MGEDDELWTAPDEPSSADFEAAEEELREASGKRALARVLTALVAALLIAALVFYFIVPLNSYFTVGPLHWRRPAAGPRSIPLAPEHRSAPKLPA